MTNFCKHMLEGRFWWIFAILAILLILPFLPILLIAYLIPSVRRAFDKLIRDDVVRESAVLHDPTA